MTTPQLHTLSVLECAIDRTHRALGLTERLTTPVGLLVDNEENCVGCLLSVFGPIPRTVPALRTNLRPRSTTCTCKAVIVSPAPSLCMPTVVILVSGDSEWDERLFTITVKDGLPIESPYRTENLFSKSYNEIVKSDKVTMRRQVHSVVYESVESLVDDVIDMITEYCV